MAATLGISPGTRTIGLVVIKGKKLVYWKLYTFKGKWSIKKREQIINTIENVIAHYHVQKVGCKNIHTSYKSVAMNELLKEIKKCSRKKNVSLSTYSVETIIRSTGVSKKNVNKKVIMDYLLHHYPELKREVLKERHNKHSYYIKLFEAIAVALMSS